MTSSSISSVTDDSHKSSYDQIDSVLKPLPPSVREFLVGDDNDNFTSTLYGYNVSRPEGSKLDILRQYSRDDGGSEKIIGICNIVTLAPFMVNGHRNDRTYYDVFAAALAMQHLNLGDGSLVKEIAGLNETCNLRFTTEFFGTEKSKNTAVDLVLKNLKHEDGSDSPFQPCAFQGAWRSGVTEHTSILTGLYNYTQVSAHSTRSELNEPQVYPKFARTIPGYTDTSQAIVSYLIHKYNILSNEPYVAIIFSNGNAGRDFNSILVEQLRKEGIPGIQIRGISIDKDGGNVSDRIERLKNLRFHYIITALDDFTKNGFDHLIEEVVREKLIGAKNNTWLFVGDLTRYDDGGRYPTNSSIVSSITGSALIVPGTKSSIDSNFRDQLSTIARSQSVAEFLDSVSPAEYKIDDTLVLSKYDWYTGCQFVYDAWIALGLGACAAVTNGKDGQYLDGNDFYDQVTKVRFDGLSGPYKLDNTTNSRQYGTTPHMIRRMFPRNCSSSLGSCFGGNITDVYTQGVWKETQSFVFLDGSTSLRFQQDPEVMLSNSGIVAVGIVLCVLSLVFGFICAIWTAINRKKRIVRASQPFFLFIICTGALILASSMIPDIMRQYTEDLGSWCNIMVWLHFLGLSTVVSAFYSMLFRLNKIMTSAKEFKRITVKVKDVIIPMVALVSVNIIILAFMTGFFPVEEINSTIETDTFDRSTKVIQKCSYKESSPFIYTLLILNVGMLILAIWEGYKAKDVSTEFQSNIYIVRALRSILIVMVICIPVLVLSRETPNATLFLRCGMVFFVVFLLLGFLFVPKYLYERKRMKEKESKSNASSSSLMLSGEKVLCQKTREELIAELAELQAFIRFESEGLIETTRMKERLGLSNQNTNEQQTQNDMEDNI